MSSIRPRGTVEVPCATHNDLAYGCKICWPGPPDGQVFFWVDALDSRLPDGPFQCEACEAGGKPNHLVCGRSSATAGAYARVRCECPPGCDHDLRKALAEKGILADIPGSG